MGTEIVIAVDVDVLHLEPLTYEISMVSLKIDRDCAIYILHVIFG